MRIAVLQKDQLVSQWSHIADSVQYAFQPLVNTHNGETYGVEALLRGWEPLGFQSIAHFFNRAEEDGLILEVSGFLLQRVIEFFRAHLAAAYGSDGTVGTDGIADNDIRSPQRLFFNLDNRIFEFPNAGEYLGRVIEESGFPGDRIVLEITEQTPLPAHAHDDTQLPMLRRKGIQIALDDFGSGFSGLQVLYESQVDIIKIDRFFITDIDRDGAKRIFITNLVNMAHAMGQRVVAEGIETEREYFVCRQIGCDYIQGFMVAKPQLDYRILLPAYTIVQQLVSSDRRNTASSEQILLKRMSQIPPIAINSPVTDILQRFRKEPETSYIPVVNEHNEPQGILREKDLKAYVYSPYGISLLMNRSYQTEFYSYINRVPIVSIYSRLEHILELYAMNTDADALIITENGAYKGCIDSKTLLQILHERELATARDQNPLSRLPGNTIINEYLSSVFHPSPVWNVLVYFDFDHFKPFNDTYGFRVGDRVILLFADLIRSLANERAAFAGHVGGDDFFLAFEAKSDEIQSRIADVRDILTRFQQDVQPFYPPDAVERGYIEGVDRDGFSRRFSLLGACAAILLIPPHRGSLPVRELGQEITVLKHEAKHSSDHIVIASIVPPEKVLSP